MRFSITGGKKVVANLKKLVKLYPDAAHAAIYQEAVEILRASVIRTPVEFGVLRSSAYAAPVRREKSVGVELGFGTDYAIFVHERTDLRHPRGGEAKFLERSIDEALQGYAGRLAKRIVENAKRGVKLGGGGFPRRPPVQVKPGGGKFKGKIKAAKTRRRRTRRK